MPHLIHSPRDGADARALAKSAAAAGWDVTRLPTWRVPSDFRPTDPVLYGEPLFARMVAAQLGYVLLEPPPSWLTGLPFNLLNRSVRLIQVAEMRALTFPQFLKPPDDKFFPAGVYQDRGDLSIPGDISDDQSVIVSEPVRFTREYRVHVVRGEAVSTSRYAIDGDYSAAATDEHTTAATAFANRVAEVAGDSTPPSVVIDVGLIDEQLWSVVEANPVFGAGIYAGEPSAILESLRVACRPLSESDPSLEAFKYPIQVE